MCVLELTNTLVKSVIRHITDDKEEKGGRERERVGEREREGKRERDLTVEVK